MEKFRWHAADYPAEVGMKGQGVVVGGVKGRRANVGFSESSPFRLYDRIFGRRLPHSVLVRRISTVNLPEVYLRRFVGVFLKQSPSHPAAGE